MSKYLNHNATLQCTHGGQVMMMPPPMRSLFIMESPVVTDVDLYSAIIVGCPQIGPGLTPCINIVSILMGLAIQIEVDGETPILSSLEALTDGCPPGFVSALDDGGSNAEPAPISIAAATMALASRTGAALCPQCVGSPPANMAGAPAAIAPAAIAPLPPVAAPPVTEDRTPFVGNASQATCFQGGKTRYHDSVVEVRTGVTYSVASKPYSSDAEACKDKSKRKTSVADGITINIKCSKKPHLYQFIYRELIGADGKHIAKTVTTTGGTYDLTTDPKKPNWNTDSAAKPDASYEAAGVHRSDTHSLTTLDQPSVAPGPGQTSRATFRSYAVCNGKVVRQIAWVREQKSGSSPTYKVSVTKATKLPDWAVAQLKKQGYNAPL